MTDLLPRAASGFLAAAAVALAARRARALSTSGAVVAAMVGTAVVAAGWAWGVLLILYFVSSSTLSRAGGAEKERRTGSVVAKGGARDGVQVLANGGVFTLCALMVPIAAGRVEGFSAAAVGALAAAAADTWATEIGVLLGGVPRTVRGFRPVPPGTSGAVSLAGTGGMVAGALGVAVAARMLGLTEGAAVPALAGCAGALADTLLGATLQERRWCAVCRVATERRVHDCGSPTMHAGGVAVLDNDAVNLLATVVGAAVALLLAFHS